MNEIKEITATELKKLLNSEQKILIVDVRSKEEYEEVHIDGSYLMELPKFNQETLEQKCASIENLKTVIFQCKSGVRSKIAMQHLEKFSYETYNLKGGISSWAGMGYKVIQDN
jgi:phage shock protein E